MILIWLNIESHIFLKQKWDCPWCKENPVTRTTFLWSHISHLQEEELRSSVSEYGNTSNLQRFVKSILRRSHGPAKMRFTGLEIHRQRLDKVWDAWLSKTKQCVWKHWRWTMINKSIASFATSLKTFSHKCRALEHVRTDGRLLELQDECFLAYSVPYTYTDLQGCQEIGRDGIMESGDHSRQTPNNISKTVLTPLEYEFVRIQLQVLWNRNIFMTRIRRIIHGIIHHIHSISHTQNPIDFPIFKHFNFPIDSPTFGCSEALRFGSMALGVHSHNHDGKWGGRLSHLMPEIYELIVIDVEWKTLNHRKKPP